MSVVLIKNYDDDDDDEGYKAKTLGAPRAHYVGASSATARVAAR